MLIQVATNRLLSSPIEEAQTKGCYVRNEGTDLKAMVHASGAGGDLDGSARKQAALEEVAFGGQVEEVQRLTESEM